ncbi:MAG: ComEC/Rec2 family competence protein [Bacteroidetes bacterium]|nr:ComEC/Rec2 family competence protein [Bacteroidota bacterium]
MPFLRLLLPFLGGILTAVYSGLQFEFFNYIILGIFFLIIFFVFIKKLNVSYSYSWIFGTLVFAILFLNGFQLTNLHTEKYSANHFIKIENPDLIYAKCNELYLEKEKSYKIVMQILAERKNGKWNGVSGKAMCYFKKDSSSKQLRYGDCVVMKTNFTEIRPPQNPSEFNYKLFLSFHTIYQQAYIPSENWKLIRRNEGNPILSASYNLREYLLNIFRENKITGDEYAVGSALVLGYTDKLDQDLINAYASSGALHVLSVSGLHVGIIFIVANFLLLFLDKIKFGKPIKIFLLLFIVWFYSILTGMSPSVLRSAAMFSLIIIAKGWKYDTNIFNTLAVSCFALLLWNPYLIMEVGFQLSYLAVLGIVAVQPWLYEKWQPTNWLLNHIWVLISVSIAAQVVTFPLGLLYFHQFPNYFLFSNMIVIPISTVILVYGLFVLAVGKIAVVGIFCSKIFSWIVWLLNESVRLTEKTPGSLLQGISISILETWLIYFLIICILIFLFQKRQRFIYPALGILILILFLQVYENYRERNQKKFIVYNIPKTPAYDFISGKQNVFISNSKFMYNQSAVKFHVKHNWDDMGMENMKFIETNEKANYNTEKFFMNNNFMQFDSKKIVVIDSLPYFKNELKQKLQVDYLILSKNAKVRIKDLQKQFTFKKIIVDSSNSEWKNKKWKKECEELNIDFYSVIDNGAYIENLNHEI